jgi:hypothetical protein
MDMHFFGDKTMFCELSSMYIHGNIHFNQKLYMFTEQRGYSRQFINIQLASQLSSQTVKLETAAFPTQQLSLHSSFPSTASHRQPKQTGPKWGF